MENPTQSELSLQSLSNPVGIKPPPILKSDIKPPIILQDYLPNQIHADEQSGGYIDCKLNETLTEEVIMNKDDFERVNEQSLLNEVKKNGIVPYPDKNIGKKAIKLITVPLEIEGLNNQNNLFSPNPQEYDSPSIDIKNQSLDVDDFRKDSPNLSPNSKLAILRKKSNLKGSPNLKVDNQRYDAEGNVINDDKKHRISFRADLYQINEVERFKNSNDSEFWKKCCKFCSIQ